MSFRKLRTAILVFLIIIISTSGGYLLGARGFRISLTEFPQVNISRQIPPEKNLDFSLFWRVWDSLEENYFDKSKLIDALAESTEIVTSLPSVNFYNTGRNSIAELIAQGLKNCQADATIIYTAENNNYAAEILEEIIFRKNPSLKKKPVQLLNTVIGKMSQVVTDPAEITRQNIK